MGGRWRGGREAAGLSAPTLDAGDRLAAPGTNARGCRGRASGSSAGRAASGRAASRGAWGRASTPADCMVGGVVCGGAAIGTKGGSLWCPPKCRLHLPRPLFPACAAPQLPSLLADHSHNQQLQPPSSQHRPLNSQTSTRLPPMAAPDVPPVQEAAQEQAVAHRAGLVLGWLQGLKQNAAQSFREASGGGACCCMSNWCARAPLQAPPAAAAAHPTPPDATRRRRRLLIPPFPLPCRRPSHGLRCWTAPRSPSPPAWPRCDAWSSECDGSCATRSCLRFACACCLQTSAVRMLHRAQATGRMRKNVAYFKVNYGIVAVSTTALVSAS